MSILEDVLAEELDRLNRQEGLYRSELKQSPEPLRESWIKKRLREIAIDQIRIQRALAPVEMED